MSQIRKDPMELARKPNRMPKYLPPPLLHRASVTLCAVLLGSLTAVGQIAPLTQFDAQGPNAYSLPPGQAAFDNMGVPQPYAGASTVTSPINGYQPKHQPGNYAPDQRQVPIQKPPGMQPKRAPAMTTIPTVVPNQYSKSAQLARPRHTVRGVLASARQAENQGNNAEAKRLYETALRGAPNDRLTLLSYARMMHRIGEFDASIALYNRLLGVCANDPVAMNDLSLCYARQGNMQQGLALLAGAVSLQPESKRYRNNIAKLLIEVNRIEEAFSHLEYAHGGAIAHFNLGSMLHQRGRDAEALSYLRAAVEMDPSLTPAIDMLATLEKSVVVDQPDRLAAAEGIESAEASERTGDAASVQLAAPLARQRWEPGSVRLQNAEMTSTQSVSESINLAVGREAVNEQVTSAAPLPFESPIRRYTRPQADSIQCFLDRQASEQ